MDGTGLVRFRWRLRGAWMWPSFVVLTLLDGLLIHWLPPVGDSASAVAGWLFGMFASIAALVLLAPPISAGIRRVRQDLPRVVARDYAGTLTTVLVTATILAAGLVHSSTVSADRSALLDATTRAEAYIGAHAAAPFLRNLGDINTYPVQAPRFYRTCVVAPTAGDPTRSYCVVVDLKKHTVKYAGSEPNGLLSQGTS